MKCAAVVLVISGLLGRAPWRSDSADSLRRELLSIASQENDLVLQMRYDAFLKKRGLFRGFWKGSTYPLGHQCYWKRGSASDSTWEFRRSPEDPFGEMEEFEVPKGPFVRYVSASGFTVESPDPEDMDDAVVIVGVDRDTLAIVSWSVGLVDIQRSPYK